MRDGRAGAMHHLQLVIGQVDAVPEHGAWPAQRVMIVDVEIALPFRKQLPDPGHFAFVLGHMSLHVAIGMLAAERTGGLQLLARTGRREARRDGVHQTTAIVPFRDQRLGFVVARLRSIPERLGRVSVHQDLAGGKPHSELFRLLEQSVDRLRIDRAIDAAAGDPVPQILAKENLGDAAGKLLVGIFLFDRIGVLVQPVEQLVAIGRNHRRLRKVYMAVDEARRNQRVRAVVPDLGLRRQQRLDLAGRTEMGNDAAVHRDDGVRLMDHRAVEPVLERIAGVGEHRTTNRYRHSSLRSNGPCISNARFSVKVGSISFRLPLAAYDVSRRQLHRTPFPLAFYSPDGSNTSRIGIRQPDATFTRTPRHHDQSPGAPR